MWWLDIFPDQTAMQEHEDKKSARNAETRQHSRLAPSFAVHGTQRNGTKIVTWFPRQYMPSVTKII